MFVALMFFIIGGDGKEYGPVTVDQVRAWITAGRANLDTKAKALGSEEWRRLGDYPEFSGAPFPPVMAPADGTGTSDTSRPAGVGARIGAALINAFFYLLCTIPGSMMISRKLLEQYPELARGGFPNINDPDLIIAVVGGVMWVWAGLLAGVVLQSILLAARGQNLGKMMVGVRVVRANGLPAGFVHAALLRFILPVVMIVVLNMLTLVLGFVFLFVDFCFIFRADGRCLHDLIAGTKMVKT